MCVLTYNATHSWRNFNFLICRADTNSDRIIYADLLGTVTFSNPPSDRRMSHDPTVTVAKWAGHFLRFERTDSNWSLTGETKPTRKNFTYNNNNNNYLTSRPRTTILGGCPPAVTLPEDLVAL